MWKTFKLEDIFKICSSKRVLKSEWRESGIPFYRGREITSLSKYGFVKNDLFISEEHFFKLSEKYGVPAAGDILITAIGTIGNTYITKEEDKFYFKDASVLWLKKIKDVSSEFINYWFRSDLFKTQNEIGNGATVDSLSISKLKSMEISIPSLSEQQRIVAKLDSAFAEIDKLIEDSNSRCRNSLKIFDNYLSNIFKEKNSNWEKELLKNISLKIGSGATPRGGKDSYKRDGISLIRSMNVRDLFFKEKDLAKIDGEQANKLENVEVKNNDVLLNITGASVARCCLVENKYLPARVNQHVSIIRLKEKTIFPRFLMYGLVSKPYKDELLQVGESSGATRQAITKKQIEEFQFRYPKDLEIQRRIIEKLDKISTLSLKLEEIYNYQIREYEALKLAFLSKELKSETI